MPNNNDPFAQYYDSEQSTKIGPDPFAEYYDGEQQEFREPERVKYTPVESGVIGAAQGATFDFGDELKAAAGAAYDVATGPKELKDLLELYRQKRDENRRQIELSQEDNPASFTGGQVAGSVATGFIPGLGVLNAAKGAGYLGKGGVLAKGALSGGIAGAGLSEQESIGGIARDVREGAGYGAAGGGLLKGAGAAVKRLDPEWIGKKGANIILNTPEDLTEKYLKLGPKRVEQAPLRHELIKPFGELKEKLKKRTIEGSKEARKQLEGIEFKGKDIGKKAGGMARPIEKEMGGKYNRSTKEWEGMRTLANPEKASAANWLREMEAEYKTAPIIKGGELKTDIQAMGKQNYKRKVGPGQFDDLDPAIKKRFQGKLNKMLKDSSPEYKKDMVKVRELTELLDRANKIGTEKGLPNVFRRTQTDEYGGGQISKEIIEKMDKELGTKFMEDVTASFTREAFDKSITNGSMNVQKFRGILEGYAPLAFLKPFAGFLGAAVDKYGRKITMNALDLTIKVQKQMKRKGVQDAQALLKPILSQAKRGNYSAMMALQILEQTHPNLKREE